jgi:hypothetical protein
LLLSERHAGSTFHRFFSSLPLLTFPFFLHSYKQPYQRYAGSQLEVQDKTYDKEFNTVTGPTTDYTPTQVDVSERQFREHTRPIATGFTVEQGHTSLNTSPNYEQATRYNKESYTSKHDSYPAQRSEPDRIDSRYPSKVRVESTTRSTVDTPKKFKRDMGYYDEDGQYHSFRHGLHKAAHKVAERVAHPIHGSQHHHSHNHSHTGSTYQDNQSHTASSHQDNRQEVIVKEKFTTTSSAPAPVPVRSTSIQVSRPAQRSTERIRTAEFHSAAPAPVSSIPARTMSPSNTITIPCHHIRIGDLLILQGRPCQVIRITTSSQTGQHRYLGVDLFTKQLHEESSFISNPAPSVVVQNMLGPVFKQYRVLDIREDGRVVAMTESGDVKQGLPVLDQSSLLTRLTESFDNGRGSVRILVIADDGQEMAVDYKVVHGSRL